MIFISAGQDPNMADPLGRMMVIATGFHAMASRLRDLLGWQLRVRPCPDLTSPGEDEAIDAVIAAQWEYWALS